MRDITEDEEEAIRFATKHGGLVCEAICSNVYRYLIDGNHFLYYSADFREPTTILTEEEVQQAKLHATFQ